MGHCSDNGADRNLGHRWERNFCVIAARHGKSFTPHQWSHNGAAVAHYRRNGKWNRWTLPDITLWTAPGEHHEIKHKAPSRANEFGLEEYRLDALVAFAIETRQPVYYTIHNWRMAGGRSVVRNRLSDWITAPIGELAAAGRTSTAITYYNGKPREREIRYWQTRLFRPLADLWSQPSFDFEGSYHAAD